MGSGTAIALAGFVLFSCEGSKFGSPRERMEVSAPASWQAASAGQHGEISSGWLDEFSDRGMSKVVNEALTHNQDLKASSARMRQAKESRISGRARTSPRVGVDGSGGYRVSENGRDPASESESYGLALAASWEIDLWGRLRDLNAADDADYHAAQAIYRGARLSLAANTAKAWCNLIAAEQLLDLSHRTLDSNRKVLGITERLFKGGAGQGALDVQLGRTNVASAERAVKSSELARNEAARSLELLLGRYPSSEARGSRDLPSLNPQIPSGLPSTLVERRPDLAIARAEIFASAKRADAARKELLPQLSLTGSSGTPVSRFANLLDPSFLATSVAANASQAIFEGGALAANARGALAANEASIHDYAQTALEAFREVESALNADLSLAEQETFLLKEVEQAALAEKQAARDYSDGSNDDILRVLESQTRATNARAGLIRLKNQRLQNRIDLHLALGGDFHTRTF
ncbi:efflux transporter outer membrane subunit [Luteolibacter sp. GHJ8]|uniref:Efflux transporter outer membrane subunit n=1 Tax=Luteolibacter rhizosphaerae TaxID=2989719 RepID=A0ABT3G2W2_9BACT|nr:efflux transporter outer membrane subunit [Luteolibacter rhizosphaerae]MCW1914196.1 efflux transporter outer membrane subunit [Luteolibacter rhizosphaerae]